MDSFKGREALQGDLDRLEARAIPSRMKFKIQCWILLLGQSNPGYLYNVGVEGMESSPAGGKT